MRLLFCKSPRRLKAEAWIPVLNRTTQGNICGLSKSLVKGGQCVWKSDLPTFGVNPFQERRRMLWAPEESKLDRVRCSCGTLPSPAETTRRPKHSKIWLLHWAMPVQKNYDVDTSNLQMNLALLAELVCVTWLLGVIIGTGVLHMLKPRLCGDGKFCQGLVKCLKTMLTLCYPGDWPRSKTLEKLR